MIDSLYGKIGHWALLYHNMAIADWATSHILYSQLIYDKFYNQTMDFNKSQIREDLNQ